MKLTGHGGQYWKNLERMVRYRREDPVETWEGMKEKLMLKYILSSFSQQLLKKWNRLTQGNKSATEIWWIFESMRSNRVIVSRTNLSRFSSGLTDDYRLELIPRGITTLEQAYQLVTASDESRGSYFHRTDFRNNSKTTTTSKPRFSRSFPAPNKPAFSFFSVKPPGPSSAKSTTSEGRTISEPGKINPRRRGWCRSDCAPIRWWFRCLWVWI